MIRTLHSGSLELDNFLLRKPLIMDILYADSFSAGLALGGEVRFEDESGLNELRAEWHNLTKRVIKL
jgi:hypothetical protein